MIEKLKREFIYGKTVFNWVFLSVGLLLQIIAIVYGFLTGTPNTVLSIISAITGIVSVVLCAEGKISFYLFGYIQLFTYVFGVAIPNHLWGEVAENIFYFITMIYGTKVWYDNYHTLKNKSSEVKIKKLNKLGWILTIGTLVIGTTILTIVLSKTNDPLPFLDSISTIPAFIAQILMCLGYRENWLYWAIIDIASVIIFVMIGNWVMAAMFIFWTINCLYGTINWTKKVKNRK